MQVAAQMLLQTHAYRSPREQLATRNAKPVQNNMREHYRALLEGLDEG